jgi:hypothetical protein
VAPGRLPAPCGGGRRAAAPAPRATEPVTRHIRECLRDAGPWPLE